MFKDQVFARYQIVATISKLVASVPQLRFKKVSNETWETIQLEGLNEEFEVGRSSFFEADLPISKGLQEGLKSNDEIIVEFFNKFDIQLKNKFGNLYIDFVDYDNGTVKIIKFYHNKDLEN